MAAVRPRCVFSYIDSPNAGVPAHPPAGPAGAIWPLMGLYVLPLSHAMTQAGTKGPQGASAVAGKQSTVSAKPRQPEDGPTGVVDPGHPEIEPGIPTIGLGGGGGHPERKHNGAWVWVDLSWQR